MGEGLGLSDMFTCCARGVCETELFGTHVGGATVHQHRTEQLPFCGHSCHGWGSPNLVLTINIPHFLWSSQWFCYGSTLFFTMLNLGSNF